MAKLALGLDYGTNSVRALLVDTATGEELASSVYNYVSGDAGVLLDRRDVNLARQDPAEYVEGFYATVREVLKGIDAGDVVGVGVDTTGSSPLPVDEKGTPLAFHADLKDKLAAYCWLWKDHTSHAEAAEITQKAKDQGQPYLAKCGGTYSSEWFWSKILCCARVAPDVFAQAYSWAECCDWITGFLTGNTNPKTMARSVCAAGHKAMYAAEWGGLPSKAFLASLDPRLADLRDRLYDVALTSDHKAGGISAEVAAKSGLREGTPVAVGAFDAHFGAVASGAAPGVLVKIIGTSTCDCMVHPMDEPLADIPGLCGIVKGSILPNCYGLEAGQSAVGDIFNWFSRFSGKSHDELTEDGLKLSPGESGLVGLDWNNGNRTILVDPLLTGLLVGQTLYTTPAEVYRALVEATAFGALKIINRLEEYGVGVREVVNCGGIAEKSAFVMQIYADVCNRPMKISRSAQTCALGSAIFGAVVGGAHKDVYAAQAAMSGCKDYVYQPNSDAVAVYSKLFALYSDLHDALGTTEWQGNLSHVMKQLIQIRRLSVALDVAEPRLADLRLEVAKANWMLPKSGLVTMHSGNASGYDAEADLLFIKPSGMDYEAITPENLVAVRVSSGEVLTKGIRPSVDLPHHLFLYRNIEGIRGVIHTHSNHATAFAALNRPVPLVLTAIADEFGAEIPCAPYVDNEGEHIGEAILKYRNRSPAILMGNHGVFAWGSSPKSALKAAIMTEDVAKTVWLACLLGEPKVIPPEEAEKWYDRYHNRYGQ